MADFVQSIFSTQVGDYPEGSAHFLRTASRAASRAEPLETSTDSSTTSYLKQLTKDIYDSNPDLVHEIDKIIRGKPDIANSVLTLGAVDEDCSDDYDTDLDVDEEDYGEAAYLKLEKHDTTGALQYIRCCEQLGVVPVRFFLRHHQETKFVMRYHGLGSKGAQALCIPLEKNTYITKLNLEGNDVESAGVVSLCKMLTENLYITEINLAENNISSEGVECMCDFLTNNNRITLLDLSGNHLGDHDAKQIASMLQKNTTLKKLYLSYNRFGDDSGLHFKDALSYNDTLQLLDLSWNHLRPTAGVLISEGVKENVGLKFLNLRMNGFSMEGAQAMASALTVNRTLMELDLSANRIPLQGIVSISKGINTNEVLVSLKLGHNPMTAAGALCLLAAIQGNENSEMKTLDLSEVYVSAEFLTMKNTLENERDLTVIHGSMEADIKRRNTMTKKEYLKKLLMKNPITKIKDYMSSNGLRLIDFFKQLDRDQSNSLTFDELKRGFERFEIEMTDAEIMKTIRLLDTDRSGDIDFQELVAGDKEHKLLRRALLKEIAILEEEEKKKMEEEKQKKQAAGEDVENVDFTVLSREEAWEAMEEVLKVFLQNDGIDD